MINQKFLLPLVAIAGLSACGGGGGVSGLSGGSGEAASESSAALIDRAVALVDENDAITDEAFFSAERSVNVPTTGTAAYAGHIFVGDGNPDFGDAGDGSMSEFAVSRATMNADFSQSTITGQAENFVGLTAIEREGRDPDFSDGRRYSGSVSFSGNLDMSDRASITGEFSGTLQSDIHQIDISQEATGALRGDDHQYLTIGSSRSISAENAREINVEFYGERPTD